MSLAEFKYDLGSRAKDKISGFTGIIVSRSQHLFGCSRYWIAPETHKDGKVEGGGWFDEDSVDIVQINVVKATVYREVDANVATEAQHTRRSGAGGPDDQPNSVTVRELLGLPTTGPSQR